jgi:HSP20 family protein
MLTNRNLTTTLDRMMTLNRAFDQMWSEGANGASPFWVPAMDVAERGEGYEILVELPGVDPSQVELSFENNVLTVRGTKAPSFSGLKEGDLRVYTLERQNGTFTRSVRLPEYVEGDRIEASYTNGVLHISVPKAQSAQPRRIPIAQQAEQKQLTT